MKHVHFKRHKGDVRRAGGCDEFQLSEQAGVTVKPDCISAVLTIDREIGRKDVEEDIAHLGRIKQAIRAG